MDKVLIDNWNKPIKPWDTVYHLGDFAYGKGSKERIESYVQQLNGKIVLIKGNHDHETRTWYLKRGITEVIGGEFYEYAPGVLLSHRPYPVREPYINIYGHVHNIITITNPNYRCVCVEQTNYTPVLLNELIKEIKDGLDSILS